MQFVHKFIHTLLISSIHEGVQYNSDDIRNGFEDTMTRK
jgi:hypothetical protein